MKHKLAIASVLTLTIISPVFAEEVRINAYGRASTTPVRVRAEIKADIETRRASTTERREDRREEVRNIIAERKASSTERRLEMQVNIAKRKVEHVKKVILATIGRLEKIIVRIESRIEKIKGRGGDTTEAENFIAAAKVNLSDATVAVDAFAGLDLSGSTAALNFETIRAAAAEAREDIRVAHRNLMMAVRSLKGPNTGVEVEMRATSTLDSN